MSDIQPSDPSAGATAPPVAPAQPLAPPTRPGALAKPARRSTWPIALGVVAIMLGALSAVSNGWGVAAPLFADTMFGHFAPEEATEEFKAIAPYLRWTSLVSLVGGALSLALLAGGIGLLCRRAWAVRTLLLWAVLKCLHAPAPAVLGYLTQHAAMAQTGAGATPIPGAGGVMDAFLIFSAALGVAWGVALPIFVLVWLRRATVRADVATWASAPRAAHPPAVPGA